MTKSNINYGVNIVCVTLLLVTPAWGIRCFQCSSYEEPACADVTTNDTSSPLLQECAPRPGRQIFCRKTVQTIVDVPDFNRVTRSCGWHVYKSNTTSNCRSADTDFRHEKSCQCFSDACNHQTMMKPNSLVVVLMINSIALLFYHHRF